MHLIKLCVGVHSVEDLADSVSARCEMQRRMGIEPSIVHTTRMTPKRDRELLDGGSLYWVIKGNIQARQELLDIRSFQDEEGIKRCDLVLSPDVIATEYQPRRAFQGWRYLEREDAPLDLLVSSEEGQLHPKMKADLMELCLL